MSHLGSRVSALVDGQLPPGAAERALAHAVACARCRAALDAERSARRAVCGAGDLEPDTALTERLVALAWSAPPGTGPFAAVGTAYAAGPRPGRRLRRAVGATAGAAAAVGGLFVLGGTAAPRLTEADLLPGSEDEYGVEAVVLEAVLLDDAVLEDAATGRAAGDVQGLPASAGEGDGTAMAIAWMRENGWSPPDVVPSDLEIVDLRQRADGVLEMELAGEDAHVVVLERHGVLESAAMADAVPIVLGDVRAHLVSVAPWSAVMQSGDAVVVVICDGTPIDGLRMLAAMPATPADTGALARVSRGWDVVRASLGGVVAG